MLKKITANILSAFILSLTCMAYAAQTGSAVNITVDKSIVYQTIDGFGAHGARDVWWGRGPFFDKEYLDRVIDDLGLTITRNEYYPKPEDPNQWPKQIPFLKAIQEKAKASGEPLKIITTFWTPPGEMKDNKSTKNGGRLLPDYYDDLSQYAAACIKDYKDAGIDLYTISLQNEPAFKEPYNSCVYKPEDYKNMLKVAGPIMKKAYPDVKIFGAEHMVWALEWPDISFEGAIIKDKDASQYIDIWACHGYGNDGKTPTPDSKEAHQWEMANKNLTGTGKHLWMTETSGYQENWQHAMQLAQSMYAALKYGKISAWVWWQISERGLGQYVLMDLGKPGKRYYVSKNYFRYIRPGAVMVDVKTGDEKVLATAYTHADKKTMTLVVLNTNEQEKSVKLSGAGLPAKFTLYRTSETENCTDVGTVSNSDTISLPARSVTTFFGLL